MSIQPDFNGLSYSITVIFLTSWLVCVLGHIGLPLGHLLLLGAMVTFSARIIADRGAA